MPKQQYQLEDRHFRDQNGNDAVWRNTIEPNSEAAESHCAATPSVFRRRLPQVLANLVTNLLVLELCTPVAFSTVLIAALLNAKQDLSVTNDQASLLGSIAFICQPIGSLISGIIVEFLGRKWSMLIVNIPFLVGWLLYCFSNSITTLYVANIILGIGIGFMEAPIMTYTAETCQPEIRDTLISISGVVAQISSFLVYLTSNVTDWRTQAGLNAALPIIAFLYITQMPETPMWLLSHGRHDEAERALCWLRGWVTPDLVREEFNQLVKYNKEANKIRQRTRITHGNDTDTVHTTSTVCANEHHENNAFEDDESVQHGTLSSQTLSCNPTLHVSQHDEDMPHSCLNKWMELLEPPTLRPLFLVISYFFLLQLGGISSIKPFMIHVFQELGLADAASWITVGSAVVGILGSGCTVFTVHWLGKRFLSIIAMLGCAVACLLLGTYSYVVLQPGGASQYATKWLPLVLIIILYFFNSIMAEIPWILLGEVFPFRTRGIASGLSSAICYVFMFTASISYLHLEQNLKLYGAFWLFCFINSIGVAFLYWKMPETDGKSLAEIEEYFTSGIRTCHFSIL
ncbi:facilitated trehalose transporter Tret1 isoform X2 [Cryptotermes secundus]|nr:facilitated trehalose transporter Tret1 isoform X2 [Cryptotermes secundus]